jgi:hypothetical protein
MGRRLSVSEARRLLPEIVEGVARNGGRVDITRRGEASVSIVRTSDLDAEPGTDGALRVLFNFAPGDLIEVVRDLRSSIGKPRPLPTPRPRARTPKR